MATVYSPLNSSSRHIRLLSLAPSADRCSPIHCSLIPLELREPVDIEYEALSYVWGNSTEKRNIYVDDSPFAVTHNLYEALLQLRQRSAVRVLWIDAICINQADIEERNGQVRQMRDVYAIAVRVLVWLGEADKADEMEDVEKAMETLLNIRETGEKNSDGMIWIQPNQVRHIYSGLGKILRRSWWTRVWVVQEATVAGEEVIAGCGTCWIPFKMFAMVQWTIRFDPSLTEDVRERVFGINEASSAEYNNVFRMWLTRRRQRANITLSELLQDTRRREATDARDKVFGLIGLLYPEPKQIFLPDYNLSVAEVYQRAMVYSLNTDKDNPLAQLELLQYALSQHSFELPSWCVDFSTKTWQDRYTALKRIHHTETQASGKIRQPTITYRTEENAILLYGTIIGNVVFAQTRHLDRSEAAPLGPEKELLPSTFLSEMLTFTQRCSVALVNRVGPEAATQMIRQGEVWRTVNWGSDILPESKHWPLEKRPDWMALIGEDLSIQLPEWSSFAQQRDTAHTGVTADLSRRLRDGITDIALRSAGCCLLATDSDYFGIGDDPVREGDILCVVFGLGTPAVLRPCGDAFELIAFAYVQGVMRGEYVGDGESVVRRSFRLI